MLEMRSIRSSQ